MNVTDDRAKSIFLTAAEIVSPDERRAFVETECAGDDSLRSAVDELLRHQESLGSFLEAPISPPHFGTGPCGSPPRSGEGLGEWSIAERPGTVIGPYKLLQQIGEGGMGVVFMAEQAGPIHRTVALKIIKPGMDTRQVIARFEAERQALAMMDHPNIARVLDAGTTGVAGTLRVPSPGESADGASYGTRSVPATIGGELHHTGGGGTTEGSPPGREYGPQLPELCRLAAWATYSALLQLAMDQISSENAFSAVEFAENPEPRVPCVLIVDTSTSMQGPRIDELNKGLQYYQQELLADPLASKRVEVAVVTFGGRVTRLVEFVTATNFEPPTLQPIGGTPMGEAINIALDMIEERKASYREHGIAYYRPWAFLITDGEPNDHWKPVASRVKAGENQKSFSFFAVGVEGANMQVLEEICVRKPLWLQGMKFRELFSWLSNSQQAVSRSSPGDEVPLEDPTTGPRGWAAV